MCSAEALSQLKSDLNLPELTEAEQDTIINSITGWAKSDDVEAPYGRKADGTPRLVPVLPLNQNPFINQEALAVLGEKEVRRRMAAAKLAPSKPRKQYEGSRNNLDRLG